MLRQTALLYGTGHQKSMRPYQEVETTFRVSVYPSVNGFILADMMDVLSAIMFDCSIKEGKRTNRN